MSAILSADDLNDFISPGVACIKPVQTSNEPIENAGEVEIQIDSNGDPLEISKIDGKASTLSAAQISLSDCLACAGCITSAEEVLVAQHSHEQLLNALREGTKSFVVSISHQSRASLAHAFGISVQVMDHYLIEFFRNQLGFKYVVGTALGRKLSLIEEARHMMRRKTDKAPHSYPVLSSVCPGWVLYAEKTHPYVIPYMSPTKSSQQVTGCLLKTIAAAELKVARADIYHLSIMPCFDKKLESARPDSFSDNSVKDVDCVLTAKELVNLVENSEFNLIPSQQVPAISQSQLDSIYTHCAPKSWPFKTISWSNDSGSASGGYAFNYLHFYRNYLIREGASASDLDIVTVEGKNSDVYELRLLHKKEQVASAAVVNGFRNIQNLVRRLKPNNESTSVTKINPLAARRRGRLGNGSKKLDEPTKVLADPSKCDYVEIMACPSGCINGGGQISHGVSGQEKEWLAQVSQLYNSIKMVDLAKPENSDLVDSLSAWSDNFTEDNAIPFDRLYHTSFNEVQKPTDPGSMLLGAKW